MKRILQHIAKTGYTSKYGEVNKLIEANLVKKVYKHEWVNDKLVKFFDKYELTSLGKKKL